MDTGDRLLSIKDIAENYNQTHVSTLLSLHAFSGSDCTSAFKGKGKVNPIKILNKNSKFIKVFAHNGEEWLLEDPAVLKGLEESTCRLYGSVKRVKSVNQLREIRLKKICGSDVNSLQYETFVDLSNFPPCQKVPLQHIKRVNYQVGVWKRPSENFPMSLLQ